MFGAAPVYGLWVRHAKNISISDVSFHYINAESRAALRFEDVKGLYLFHVIPQTTSGVKPMVMKDVSDVTIVQSQALEGK